MRSDSALKKGRMVGSEGIVIVDIKGHSHLQQIFSQRHFYTLCSSGFEWCEVPLDGARDRQGGASGESVEHLAGSV